VGCVSIGSHLPSIDVSERLAVSVLHFVAAWYLVDCPWWWESPHWWRLPTTSRLGAKLHFAIKNPLNAAQQVPGNEHQIAHEQDHEPAVHIRNLDMRVVNDHGDNR